MNGVVVFAPSPVLTVTVEDHGGRPDIHLHAGGQGVWQARMLVRLGAPVTMCAALGGESGQILRHLLEDEGVTVRAVTVSGRNGAYIHDRRDGHRVKIAEAEADPLSRHALDELYGLTLSAGLDAGAVVLSGPAAGRVLPADVYRRLAADLRATRRHVVADLSGERLDAVLAGGVTVVKVSEDELRDDGRILGNDQPSLVKAMYRMHEEGAVNVIVSRAAKPALVLTADTINEVQMPTLQAADTHGAGDSLTAGVAASLARGGTMTDAVRLGSAAGMLNVTRHGLGTGELDAVLKLRELVHMRPLRGGHRDSTRVTPRDLAERLRRR